jgi:hypothetical protein
VLIEKLKTATGAYKEFETHSSDFNVSQHTDQGRKSDVALILRLQTLELLALHCLVDRRGLLLIDLAVSTRIP